MWLVIQQPNQPHEAQIYFSRKADYSWALYGDYSLRWIMRPDATFGVFQVVTCSWILSIKMNISLILTISSFTNVENSQLIYTANRLIGLCRDHSFCTFTKFSEKITFLTPRYTHICVRIRRLEMLVFRKILRTYYMNDHVG